MGKTIKNTKLPHWSEVNKTRKEEKRKWKEANLLKKIEKQKLESEFASNQTQLPTQIEPSTISIAVPGSILENAQSSELRTYLAGQIARAVCIFQIDEIVVFDDYGDEASSKKTQLEDSFGVQTARECCIQLGRILQYLECPQYLRKYFFPIHKHLQFCGLLNPLNAPHHLSKTDIASYREGVVVDKQIKNGAWVNVGLMKDVKVDRSLTPGVRCTVKIQNSDYNNKKIKGTIVPPSLPRAETGVYWGYKIRIANSLSAIFSQAPYKEGYDLTIGTSDKGDSIDDFSCAQFDHLLIIFGGLNGLEGALENDIILKVDDPRLLFDKYLNTLPQQGSKTIRTEEAILVTMGALRPKLNPKNPPKMFKGLVIN